MGNFNLGNLSSISNQNLEEITSYLDPGSLASLTSTNKTFHSLTKKKGGKRRKYKQRKTKRRKTKR